MREVEVLCKANAPAPLPVLITSRLLGLHLRRLLAEHGVPHVNLRFMTLQDLATHVALPHFLRTGMTRMPPFAPEAIIAHTVESLTGEDKGFYFTRIADRSGFHKAMLSTINDLREACLSPADLERILTNSDLKTAVHTAKLRDVVRVWQRYEETLNKLGWFDELNMMEHAAGDLVSSKLIRQAPAILVYGFYDFNALQRQLLDACIRARDILVFFPYEDTRSFNFVRPTIAWLKSMGFTDAAADLPADKEIPRPLAHIRRHLFEGGQKLSGPQNAITFVSSPGEVREVREILRAVIEECRRQKIGLHEVAILMREPQRYAGLLRDAFRQLDITPYMPQGQPLSDTRAGRTLRLLLEIQASDFSRHSVLEFATFAPLRLERFSPKGKPPTPPSAWDAVSIAAGIVEGEHEWDRRLSRLLQDRKREADRETHEGFKASVEIDDILSLRSFMKRLAAAIRSIKQAKTYSDKAERLLGAFQYLVEQDDGTPEVIRAVGALKELDCLGTHPDQSRFNQMVRESLESESPPLGRFQRNGPTVVNLMSVRGIPFRIVVVPGMVEKSFPPAIRQDAILLDHEREAINSVIKDSDTEPLSLKVRRRLDEERLLFRFTVGAAERRLILSFPRLAIGTARERLPSSFVLAAIEALTGSRTDFESIETAEGLTRIPLAQIAVGEPERAIDETEFDLSAAAGSLMGTPEVILGLDREAAFFIDALRLEGARWGTARFTSYDGMITGPQARNMLKRDYTIVNAKVSPTRLETYAGCPFKYLLGTIMKIEPVIEPEYAQTINPLDRGTLVHSILWDFFTTLKSKRSPPIVVQRQDADLLHRIANRRFRQFERSGVVGYPAMWELEKGNILFYLDDFLKEEIDGNDFHASYFEVRYGMRSEIAEESEISTEKAVPLAFGGRKTLIRGRIDRIDLSGDGRAARIVDYKTGKPYAKENDFQGGTALQLPLYLLAADTIFGDLPGRIKVIYAEYYHLTQQGKNRHIRFDREVLQAKQKELHEILKTIADGIEAGLFFPLPGRGCDFCDFDLICGPYRHTIFERKLEDPRIRAFLKMRGELDEETQ